MGKKSIIFLISGIFISSVVIYNNAVKIGGDNYLKEENNKMLEDLKDKNNEENKEIINEENNTVNDIPKNEEVFKEQENKEDKEKNEIDKNLILSENHREWYFKRNKEHKRPEAYKDIEYLKKYDAYYIGEDTKTIYLTFDEGSDTTYAKKNLDVLKKHNIKAIFFVTKPFINKYPEIINRMVNEGHIVGNHTARHKSMPTLTVEEYIKEIKAVEESFKQVTGRELDKYFRYPMGDFSDNTLSINKKLGYKTLFWSYAFADWDELGQESKDKALNNMITNYHNGAIYLLHGVNKYNSEALDDFITHMKKEGYSFGIIK